MYKLSKHEENLLKVIIKHARIDYFRSNNLYFDMEDIDNLEIQSNTNVESDIINNYEARIQVNELENFFTEENMFKITNSLKYNEKLLIFLFYVEEKSDKEIAQILSTTWRAINSKRMRIIKKIRDKLREGEDNV